LILAALAMILSIRVSGIVPFIYRRS
jgi:hypothetical protein